jgi:assimilatory nitrate reductase catalytic subunit
MSTDTTCPYCGVGCGVRVAANLSFAGDPGHPANLGRLCSKGSALGETLSLDGRLLHPEISGVRTDWNTALDLVAHRFADTVARHGPDSVALYVSGQLLTEDYYAANKFTKGFLGTGNIDSNSRLCMASAVAGHKRAFGEDLVPGIYEDLELADLVVLVGSNTAWCHPVIYQRILAARAARPHTRLVVIDPRRTASCEGADLHLKLRPGTDVALFSGLLAQLGDSKDPATVLARTQTPSLAATADLCGLDTTDLAVFFAWFAKTSRVVTLFSQGVNQSSAGADKVNAIINVHLATGRIGVPGAGPFSITGQPNAMGGREVGALANTLAAHLEWSRPGDVDLLKAFWNAPNLAMKPGRTAVDLFQAIGRGEVRAIWIMATNPAVSLPEAEAVRAALRGCETVVVSEATRSDTVDLAHVVLPALAWGEKSGTVTNSERMISRQRAFLPAPGEAKADWWAVAQVAARMGFGAEFGWSSPAEIFREHASLSGTGNTGQRVFDISALASLSDAAYEELKPTRWPCPAGRPAPARLMASGGILVPTPARAPAQAPSAAFPLRLNTGRIRDQWHTMTRTGKSTRLHAHLPEPFLSIHRDDAGNIADGALVSVEAATGSAVLRARIDPGQRPGDVYAPMHWTDRFCPAGRINPVVNAATDPVSFQPELKHTPVRITRYEAGWHGFLIARAVLGTDLAEWTALFPTGVFPTGVVPTGVAWRHELAGQGAPEDAFARLRATCAAPGTWIVLQDPAAGMFRAALVEDGRLEAVLFVGPDHDLPQRDWLASLFALDRITTGDRRALLAGRPAEGPLPERPVCVCFGVGAGAIRHAIASGCSSVEAVGVATTAGTNCGSCRPEIRTLLAMVPA